MPSSLSGMPLSDDVITYWPGAVDRTVIGMLPSAAAEGRTNPR